MTSRPPVQEPVPTETLANIDTIDVPAFLARFARPYGHVSNIRLIPDALDGLLPVRRRILFTADDMGLTPSSHFMKAARLVGEVMGKLHPHGDSAIYGAVVTMAQAFSIRYPLIDGQGNFGNIDGDGAAAMRYTEVRLTALGQQVVRDLYGPDANVVDWADSYDGTQKEPSRLPVRFPVLLANGTDGIGWGDATKILPHNLRELVDACCAMIDDPDLETAKLARLLHGPDFPGGGIVVGLDEWIQILETGYGHVTCRAKMHLETIGKKQAIIVTEIPYQVQKGKGGDSISIVERVEMLVNGTKQDRDQGRTPPLAGVVGDIHDESGKNGMRLVITLEQGVRPDRAMNEIFRLTDLQKRYTANQTVLVKGLPEMLGTKALLRHYLVHQFDVLTRRTRFYLDRAQKQLELEEAIIIAHQHAEELVVLAKAATDKAALAEQIVKKYQTNQRQAEYIADLPLRRYAKLDMEGTKDRIAKLKIEIAEYQRLLGSKAAMGELLKSELREIKAKFGDDRRTEIDHVGTAELKSVDELIEDAPCWVTLTAAGLLNRLPAAAFRAQKRGGVGAAATAKPEDDPIVEIIGARTRDRLFAVTDAGNLFGLRLTDLDESSRGAKGTHLRRLGLGLPETERVVKLVVPPANDEGFLVLATAGGKIKRTPIAEYENLSSAGLRTLVLVEGDSVVAAFVAAEGDDVISVTSDGYAVRYALSEAPSQGRVAQGVASVKTHPNATVIGVAPIRPDDHRDLLVLFANGKGKRSSLATDARNEGYPRKGRAIAGVTTAVLGAGVSATRVVCAVITNEDDLLVAVTSGSKVIATAVSEIKRTFGRASAGVAIIAVSGAEKVTGGAIASTGETPEKAVEKKPEKKPLVKASKQS